MNAGSHRTVKVTVKVEGDGDLNDEGLVTRKCHGTHCGVQIVF